MTLVLQQLGSATLRFLTSGGQPQLHLDTSTPRLDHQRSRRRQSGRHLDIQQQQDRKQRLLGGLVVWGQLQQRHSLHKDQHTL
jgi:hypothetical protein